MFELFTILVIQQWIVFSSGLSLGESIQSVSSIRHGIELAGKFWLPSDRELPPHYSQPVHHESRQRWASQLLDKMFQISAEDPLDDLDFQDSQWNRLVNAAAIPHDTASDRPNKEGIWLCSSLSSIYGLVSRKQGLKGNTHSQQFQPETLMAIRRLVERSYELAGQFTLDQACQLHWSVEGLYARIPELERISRRPELFERLDQLPFEVIPLGLDWSNVLGDISLENNDQVCEALIESIPFSKETITTRRGESVQERRGTAWIAKQGIGSLAYSGKLMTPHPIPDLVLHVMRIVEERLDLANDGSFFDCALCNHYADATAACKWHTDPEHGTFWHRTTVVVAAGMDRKFSFKPIATSWSDWDPLKVENGQKSMAASINLFSGDIVLMKDNCNDEFYHAVHAGDSDKDRVSLVLKRALNRNGKKGHGQQGQGRKSRWKLQSSNVHEGYPKDRRNGNDTVAGVKARKNSNLGKIKARVQK